MSATSAEINPNTHPHKHKGLVLPSWAKPEDIPDHVHHKDDVEDNEEVVCVPEDLIVGHSKIKRQNDNMQDYFQKCSYFQVRPWMF